MGQSGIEYAYDRYLRGRDGAYEVQVDALGEQRGTGLHRPPAAGQAAQALLDLELQGEGQRAMSEPAITVANRNGNPANAGAFVAMDPRNGEILAMGSFPSFDPNVFAKPVSPSKFQRDPRRGGAAALQPRDRGPVSDGVDLQADHRPLALEPGSSPRHRRSTTRARIKIGEHQSSRTPGGAANGAVTLRRGAAGLLRRLLLHDGRAPEPDRRRSPSRSGRATWASGRLTGVDLPGEIAGTAARPAWRARSAPRRRAASAAATFSRRAAASPTSGPWTVGDNVNLAVGQGDLQATPLQMAVAYSTSSQRRQASCARTSGCEVEDSAGRVLQQHRARAPRAA